MKLAFICRGKSDSGNGQPLQYLENSCNTVEEILTQHDWQCENIELKKLDDYANILQNNTDKEEISELIFYFIGHGDFSPLLDFHILLEDETTEPYIEHIINKTKKSCNNRLPSKMAIVIDSCYSGKIIDSKVITKKLHKHIEILTSSSDDEKSYESSSLEEGRTVFSHYFCEAIENDNLKLSDIKEYIYSKTESIIINEGTNDENIVSQRPYCTPAQEKDKIILGNNKEINEVRDILKESYPTLKDFRAKVVQYYGQRIPKYQQILDSNNYSEIINIILKNNEKCLFCILKELNIETSLLDEEKFSDINCMELKIDEDSRIIKKIVLRISLIKGDKSECLVECWLINDNDISVKSDRWDIDFSKNNVDKLSEEISKILENRKVDLPIDMDLILADELFSIDFRALKVSLNEANPESYLFRITTRLLSRDEKAFNKNLIISWDSKSIEYSRKSIERIEDNIYPIDTSIQRKLLGHCFRRNKSIIISRHNILTEYYLEMIKTNGIPVVLSPFSNKPIDVNFNWKNGKIKDLKELVTLELDSYHNEIQEVESSLENNEITEEEASRIRKKEKNIHLIYDIYEDVIKFKEIINESEAIIKG